MIFDVAIISEVQDLNNFENISRIDDLMKFAFWTVAVEVPIFYFCGYRKFEDYLYFAAVNVISNLLLNEFLMNIDFDNYMIIVLIGEVFVVILEFVLCWYVIKSDRQRLLKIIIFTNVVSFISGMIYYGIC